MNCIDPNVLFSSLTFSLCVRAFLRTGIWATGLYDIQRLLIIFTIFVKHEILQILNLLTLNRSLVRYLAYYCWTFSVYFVVLYTT